MRTRKHALQVAERIHHGYDVILDITQIEADLHTWRDLVIFVAALRKAFQDVGFAAKETHQAHDVFANVTESGQKGMVFFVIWSCAVDIIVENICGILDFCDGWTKVIDDIVSDTASN